MSEGLDVPPVVRNKAIAVDAAEWLATLPDLIRHVERSWNISVGRAYPDPTEAYVAEAVLGDGTPAVLKLLIPREGRAARNEITLLELAAGHGCAALLRHDEPLGALLLERLGRSLRDLALPIGSRHEILCATAGQIWRPAPDCGLPSGAEKARWLTERIVARWRELDEPCSEQAVDHAVTCSTRREAAHRDELAVLVHGDVHEWNVLQAANGFKLVDPDGLLAEPEYDLGIIMREDPVELLAGDPHERARWLSHRTGRDATAIWEWGVVERVSTGLLATEVGLQPVGRQMLEAADRIAERRD